MILPTVIEKGHPVDRAYDIYSCLLKERIVFCTKPIDDSMASVITAQLLYLDSLNHDDIYLYINSPGGSVSAGLSIIDTMNLVHSDVSTVCMGQCASMASVILMCGSKGKRCILKHGYVMIHQPLGNMEGKVSDLENTARHFIEIKKLIIDLIHDATEQDKDKIEKDIENDTYLNAKQTLKYGIADTILEKKE